ncbi:MAG: hypothetical protein H6613_03730 [Ignavibacteriales bacterium]|nr:hypothetical protein [Ignavibacteriales bacterium]
MGYYKFSDPNYLTLVHSIEDAGHEIMDHTPNHRTNYFITSFPVDIFLY